MKALLTSTLKAACMWFLWLTAVSLPAGARAQTGGLPQAPARESRAEEVIELWPDKVPDETGNIGPERARMSPKLDRKQVEVTEQTRLVTDVTKPSITIRRPPK